EEGAVGTLGQPRRSSRSTLRPLRARDGVESVGERCERAGRTIETKWREHDAESGLRQGSAVPGAVERDEGTTAILRRKLTAHIEQHSVRRPVTWECHQCCSLIPALTGLLSVASILRRQHQSFAIDIVIAVRPTVISAPIDSHQFFARILSALFDGKKVWPVVMQLIAPVNGCIQIPIQRIAGQCNRVSQASREPTPVALALSQPVGVEIPNAGARVELGAWIVTRPLRLPIPLLTCVRGGADIEVKRSSLEHEIVWVVRAGHWEIHYDRVRLSDWRE